MRSKSRPGSSTPTSRPTDRFSGPRRLAFTVLLIALAGVYVIEAFIAPQPLIRIALRCFPVLPVAVWTLWYEKSRPFKRQPAPIRAAGRILLLLMVMAFAVAVLGLGLNWLYDPTRVI
jgi:cell division septal protein FtsQ